MVFIGLAFLVFFSLKRKSENNLRMLRVLQLLLVFASSLVTFATFHKGYLQYRIDLGLIAFSLDFFFFSMMAFFSLYYLLMPIARLHTCI